MRKKRGKGSKYGGMFVGRKRHSHMAGGTKRYLAFDPGEVWMGMAALEVSHEGIIAESRVIHLAARRGIGEVMDEIVLHLPAIVIAEDYRIQPMGHQRFSGGDTLRMLGALEAQINNSKNASKWFTIPPGDAKETDELFDIWLGDWRQSWQPSSQWRHALSAWRILGRHLMETDMELLMSLRQRSGSLMKPWLTTFGRRPTDLIAPAWRTDA